MLDPNPEFRHNEDTLQPIGPKTTKRCSTCKEEKPLSDFHRRNHFSKDGRRSACKACTSLSRAGKPQRAKKEFGKKSRVRQRTTYAIKKGILLPKPCEQCGAAKSEAHHENYDAPDAHLTVHWLCRGCHMIEHGKRPWTRQLGFGF